MTEALIRAEPRADAVLTLAQARAQLVATRERTRAQLAELEAQWREVVSWRHLVRRHPVATLVGALAVGFAVAQLWRRR